MRTGSILSSTTATLSLAALFGLVTGILVIHWPNLFSVFVGLVVIFVWVRLLNRSYVMALSVFVIFLPLWIYLKLFAWPRFTFHGHTIFMATILKDTLLSIFLLHWIVTKSFEKRVSIVLLPCLVIYFVFVLIGAARVPLSSFPVMLRPYIEMFLLVALPVISSQLDEADVQQLLQSIVVGGGLIAIVALYHLLVDPEFLLSRVLIRENIIKNRHTVTAFFGPRLQSIAGNPNTLGRVMLLTGIMSIGLFKHASKLRSRLFYGSVAPLTIFILVLSRSRDDLVLFFAGVLAMTVLTRRYWVLGGTMAIGSIAVASNWGQLSSVFIRLIEKGNPRIAVWQAALEFYGVDLITGSGARLPVSATPYTFPLWMDSVYLQMAIQIGLLGIIAFLFFNFRVIHQLAESSRLNGRVRSLNATIAVCLGVILAGGVFSVSLMSFPGNFLYWLLFALGARLLISQNETEGI